MLGFKTGTGNTGTGTVSIFSTPRHTAYPCRGITGIHGFTIVRLSLFFSVLNYFLNHLNHYFLLCHTVTVGGSDLRLRGNPKKGGGNADSI